MLVLEAIQVYKEYSPHAQVRVQALRGVSLRVEASEFLAIMGPSGCGKSTLLHLLGGIDSPTSGQVLLDGQDLGGLDDTQRSIARRRRLGFVFQRMNLLPTLSALENVALPLRIDGVGRAAASERAREEFGASEPSGPHGAVSARAFGGRAATCGHCTGAGNPTCSRAGRRADRSSRQCQWTNRLVAPATVRRPGQTIVMVTHDASLAEQADRIVSMCDGIVVGDTARLNRHGVDRRAWRNDLHESSARHRAGNGANVRRRHRCFRC